MNVIRLTEDAARKIVEAGLKSGDKNIQTLSRPDYRRRPEKLFPCTVLNHTASTKAAGDVLSIKIGYSGRIDMSPDEAYERFAKYGFELDGYDLCSDSHVATCTERIPSGKIGSCIVPGIFAAFVLSDSSAQYVTHRCRKDETTGALVADDHGEYETIAESDTDSIASSDEEEIDTDSNDGGGYDTVVFAYLVPYIESDGLTVTGDDLETGSEIEAVTRHLDFERDFFSLERCEEESDDESSEESESESGEGQEYFSVHWDGFGTGIVTRSAQASGYEVNVTSVNGVYGVSADSFISFATQEPVRSGNTWDDHNYLVVSWDGFLVARIGGDSGNNGSQDYTPSYQEEEQNGSQEYTPSYQDGEQGGQGASNVTTGVKELKFNTSTDFDVSTSQEQYEYQTITAVSIAWKGVGFNGSNFKTLALAPNSGLSGSLSSDTLTLYCQSYVWPGFGLGQREWITSGQYDVEVVDSVGYYGLAPGTLIDLESKAVSDNGTATGQDYLVVNWKGMRFGTYSTAQNPTQTQIDAVMIARFNDDDFAVASGSEGIDGELANRTSVKILWKGLKYTPKNQSGYQQGQDVRIKKIVFGNGLDGSVSGDVLSAWCTYSAGMTFLRVKGKDSSGTDSELSGITGLALGDDFAISSDQDDNAVIEWKGFTVGCGQTQNDVTKALNFDNSDFAITVSGNATTVTWGGCSAYVSGAGTVRWKNLAVAGDLSLSISGETLTITAPNLSLSNAIKSASCSDTFVKKITKDGGGSGSYGSQTVDCTEVVAEINEQTGSPKVQLTSVVGDGTVNAVLTGGSLNTVADDNSTGVNVLTGGSCTAPQIEITLLLSDYQPQEVSSVRIVTGIECVNNQLRVTYKYLSATAVSDSPQFDPTITKIDFVPVKSEIGVKGKFVTSLGKKTATIVTGIPKITTELSNAVTDGRRN